MTTTKTDPRIAELERQRDRAVEHDLEHTERLTWEWHVYRETREHLWSQATRGLARRATAQRRDAAAQHQRADEWQRTAAAYQEIGANLQAELDQLCAALHTDVPLPTDWRPARADDGSWQVTGSTAEGQSVAIRIDAASAASAQDVARAVAQALTVLTEPATTSARAARPQPTWTETRRCWEFLDITPETVYVVDDPDDAIEARLWEHGRVVLTLHRIAGEFWQITSGAHPIATAPGAAEFVFASPDVAADAVEMLIATDRGRREKATAHARGLA